MRLGIAAGEDRARLEGDRLLIGVDAGGAQHQAAPEAAAQVVHLLALGSVEPGQQLAVGYRGHGWRCHGRELTPERPETRWGLSPSTGDSPRFDVALGRFGRRLEVEDGRLA